MRRFSRIGTVAGGVALATTLGVAALGCGATRRVVANAPGTTTSGVAPPAPRTTTREPENLLRTRAVIATARGRVAVYRRRGASHAVLHYGKTNSAGQPTVFLVARRRPSWEKVYLPKRPDGSTGWVRDRSVSLTYDSYRVVVSLGRHRVWVYQNGKPLLVRKAGVGRSTTSTPKGTYFLVTLLKQPDPNGAYGPYAFGTSAFSTVLYHFGGGQGEIGLHGTDDPTALGTNVSHGCIRISNATITRLAKLLPLGTPITIEE
jgi:lipoprotein-anchoring transpeptidase ErfK/SrfK